MAVVLQRLGDAVAKAWTVNAEFDAVVLAYHLSAEVVLAPALGLKVVTAVEHHLSEPDNH